MIDENDQMIDIKELEEEESKENTLLSIDEIKDDLPEPEFEEENTEEETDEDIEDFEPEFGDSLEDEEFGGEE